MFTLQAYIVKFFVLMVVEMRVYGANFVYLWSYVSSCVGLVSTKVRETSLMV